MAPIDVIVNARGGSFVDGKTGQELKEAFGTSGADAVLHVARDGGEVEQMAEKASNSSSDVIVAGGGDGTINTVAVKVLETGKTLGVIPLGTVNHFSKDLGIPQDVSGAVATISDGHKIKVDVGDINGRIFLNNSSIGLYPRIVRHRNDLQQRLGRGKWYSAFIAALKVFRRDPFFRVQFEIEGKHFSRKTPFVFVGNNEYRMDIYNIGGRSNLTAGRLSVYLLRRGGRWGVIVMLFRTLLGRLRQWKDFETFLTRDIIIDVRKSPVMVAIDGEVSLMETPLRYHILPEALTVLVPRPKKSDA
jgi:YegS/Rv2252/BmrU family lipid kinase